MANDAEADAIFRRADAAWERGRNRQAFALFMTAARLGQASAQHNLGYFYELGVGTRKNTAKALFWYRKAWHLHRQTDTCINIAQLHASKGNRPAALRWWRKAVRLGDGDAALDLAKYLLSRKSKRHAAEVLALLHAVGTSAHVTEGAVDEAAELLGSIPQPAADGGSFERRARLV